jgi:hypothetical protein
MSNIHVPATALQTNYIYIYIPFLFFSLSLSLYIYIYIYIYIYRERERKRERVACCGQHLYSLRLCTKEREKERAACYIHYIFIWFMHERTKPPTQIAQLVNVRVRVAKSDTLKFNFGLFCVLMNEQIGLPIFIPGRKTNLYLFGHF